ncbi:cytochrome b-c1 complex subunit 1, mitochondrial-like [Anticarsia gemmatalis]|uniref:cytochrome b-c1 complex subunit 1, mitochondrial-like n=1 Tax=Anticarsia gemmatalis TaxID=129554 RepID=UPI003F75E0AD
MFKSVLRLVPRFTAPFKRTTTAWCPEEPFDPHTRVTYLPNGVRVLTEETYSPLTCVSLFVVAGSRYETAHTNGLAHFFEHLAFKCQLDRKVQCVCAKLTVKTRREMQFFSMLVPSQLAQSAVMTLSEILTALCIDENQLEHERYNICLDLLDSDNNPKAIMFDNLHAAAFQGTPLAQPVMGPLRNVSRFNKEMTETYVKENYTTCRLILATSGGVSHDNIVDTAGSSFGMIPPSGHWEADSGTNRYTSSEILYRDDSMTQAHVALAVEAPGYTSPDYMPMYVMSCLIGSWSKSRQKWDHQPDYAGKAAASFGQCESFESFYIVYKDVGLWGIYFVAERPILDDLIFAFQHAWMEMILMPHRNMVERAKAAARLKLRKRYNGVVNSCRDMGIQMMYKATRKPLDEMIHHVDVVLPHAFKEMGEKYILNQGPVVSAVGPTETLPEFTRTIAGMYWLRL